MVGRLLLMVAIGGLAAGAARLATRPRRRRHSAPITEAAGLAAITRDPARVRVRFEGELPEPGSGRAAHCWLTDTEGQRYHPTGVLRQASSLPVLETHWFSVPHEVADLRLHLTAGLGQPVLTMPVPAAPVPAEPPVRLIA